MILLNFKNGNDLMERDALTLVALIERLNQTYGSQYLQDITVMGPSSGGLVVQYALAYMEHNNIPHRVKTFVAFDTQFQGANVPIGFQYFLEYLSSKGILFAINKTRNLLSNGLYNSYVSKQMLAHHHSAGSVTPAHHPYRTQFLANLAAVGEYPQLCRKVAIINGVNTGAPTNITPNTTMLNIAVYRNGIAGICNGNLCKKLDWTCKSTSNSGTNTITQMYTVAPAFNLLLQQPLGYKSWAAGPTWNNSSLDNAPGSTFVDIFGNDPGEVNEDKFVFLLRQAMYLLTGSQDATFTQGINKFTIVPSYNSADLRYPNKNLYLNWSNDYLCGKTPLDFVYAAGNNQIHAERNNTNLQYFENEIKCDVTGLPTFIGEITNIPSSVCSTATAILEQCKTNMNYSYTWTSSNPNVLQVSGTGGQATLNKVNNGTVTVSVNIVGCGLNVTRQKIITVGTPIPTIQSVTYFGNEVGLTALSIPDATYNWYEGGILTESGGSNTYITDVACNTTKFIQVEAVNTCGTSSKAGKGVSVKCSSGGQFRLAPNPASSTLTVLVNESVNQLSSSSVAGIHEIRIFDKFGTLKKSMKYPNGTKSVTINTTQLPTDVYSIQIYNGTIWDIQQLVVEH